MARKKILLHNYQSPGDIVMLTAAVRDLAQSPYGDNYEILVDTACGEIWENNPYCKLFPVHNHPDEARQIVERLYPDIRFIKAEYPLIHWSNQAPFHFIHGFRMHLETELGHTITPCHPDKKVTFKGDIHLSYEEINDTDWAKRRYGLEDGFWVMFAGGKYDFTCMPGDTRVLTNLGYRRLDAIEQDKQDTYILTETGAKKFDCVKYMGKKLTKKITTIFGDTFVATDEHLVKVFDANSSSFISWKEVKYLTDDDYLLQQCGNRNLLPIDTKEDVEKWYCIGHLWGDGLQYNNKRCFWIISEDEYELYTRIENYFIKNNINYSAQKRVTPNSKIIFGLNCHYNHFKEIPNYQKRGKWRNSGFPDSYWALGKKQMGALLNGLFSTDGTVDKLGHIYFTTVYEQLGRDVKEMLLLLGIKSMFLQRKLDNGNYGPCVYYNVSIVGLKDASIFNEIIGFSCISKQQRLNNILSSRTFSRDMKGNIPFSQKVLCGFLNAQEKNITRKKTYADIVSARNGNAPNTISESFAKQIIQDFSHYAEKYQYQFLKEFIENDWFFAKVEKIEDGSIQEVYDVINSESQSYVSNGLVSHNCKWWNPQSYQSVVDYFQNAIQFVQVGEKSHWHPPLKGSLNLIGQTNLRDLIRLIYHSSGVVCPVTFGMHAAAAIPMKKTPPINRPCVVIAGGREPAQWEAYPHHRFLSTNGALDCCDNGGCWKSRCQKIGDGDEKDYKDLCLYPDQIRSDLVIPRCMSMIKPTDVIRAIDMYYEGGVLQYKNRPKKQFKKREKVEMPELNQKSPEPPKTTSLFRPRHFEEARDMVVGNCNGVSMDERWKLETPIFAEAITRYIQTKNAKSVVDYGCGCGRVAKAVLEMNPQLEALYGIDASNEMLKAASDYCQDSRFVPLRPKNTPVGTSAVVYSIYCIQHIPAIELRDALFRMHEAVTSDGVFINCSSMFRMAINFKDGTFFDDSILGVNLKNELERVFTPMYDLFSESDYANHEILRVMVKGEGGKLPHPAVVFIPKQVQ